MTAPILPGAEPYSAVGDARGALVLHGFTGNPQSMRGLAVALADAGLTVELPLLPGHGTAVEDMVPTRWEDWSAAAEAAYVELATRCEAVVVVGLSMGGTLGVWLGERHPDIAGLVLVNPLIEPPDADTVAFIDALIAGGDELAPGVGSDIAQEGSVESAYPELPLRAAALPLRGRHRGLRRSRRADMPHPAVLEHPGPCGGAGVGRPPGRGRQWAGGADRAGAQLPCGHPRLRQGGDREADRCVRDRSPPPDGGMTGAEEPGHQDSGSPGRLSRDDVIHVANLARLTLSDEEVDLFTAQLRTVLDHAADVAALDLSHLAPTAHPLPVENVLRPDEPRPSLDRAEVLAAAPSVEDHRFRVPRIGGEAP